MNDVQDQEERDGGELPTLSELLSLEAENGADSSDSNSEEGRQGLTVAERDIGMSEHIPTGITRILEPPSFSESVQEELDWLLADDALLPVATRNRLLAAAQRALELRRVTATEGETENAWQEQLADLPEDRSGPAKELITTIKSIESGNIRVAKFSPSRVAQLTAEAGVDPVISFAVFDRAIRRRTGQSALRRIPILAGRSDDSWINWLSELRHLLLGEGPADVES